MFFIYVDRLVFNYKPNLDLVDPVLYEKGLVVTIYYNPNFNLIKLTIRTYCNWE